MKSVELTMIEVVVFIIVSCALLSMAVKAIQLADESAAQTASANHVKKLVQGIQSYENTLGYLPPLKTANNHPGWNLRILPYMGYEGVHNTLSQAHLYDRDYQGVLTDAGATPVDPYDIGDRNAVGAVSTFSGNAKTWYRFTMQTSGNPMDAVTKNDGDGITWQNIHAALSRVVEFRNPSRQPLATIKKVTADTIYSNSFVNLKFDSDLYEQSCMRGAVSDYAAAFSKRELVLKTYNLDQNGDFKDTATSEGIDKSTAFIIGEKHIPPFAVNTDTPISNMWNGGLHRTHATINAFCGSLRYINLDVVPENTKEGTLDKNGVPIVITKHPIAVTNAEVANELSFLSGNGNIRYPSTFATGEYLWGSNSPSTLSIGLLDGSVKAVSKEIDANVFNRSWLPAPTVTIFVD